MNQTTPWTHRPVLTLMEDLFDQFPIIEHHGQPEGLGVLLELEVDLDGGVEQYGVFWFWDILDTTGEVCIYGRNTVDWGGGRQLPGKVQAHSPKGFRGYQGHNQINLLYLHEEVTCFSLCTVLEAVRGKVHNQAMKAVLRGGENCPLLWDLGTHMSDGGDTKVNIKRPHKQCTHALLITSFKCTNPM